MTAPPPTTVRVTPSPFGAAPVLERGFVATLITHPDRLGLYTDLGPDALIDTRARLVYRVLRQMHERGVMVSRMSVLAAVSTQYELVDGVSPQLALRSLFEVGGGYGDGDALDALAEQIRERHATRIAAHAGATLTTAQPYALAERIEDARAQLHRAEMVVADHDPMDLSVAFKALFTQVEANVNRGDGLSGLDTGFSGLNEAFGGWQGGNLHLLGADTGVGKTAFLVASSLVGLKAGKRQLVVSPEMSPEEVALRYACNLTRQDTLKVMTGKMGEGGWSRLAHAMGRISEWQRSGGLYLDCSPTTTPSRVLAKARRLMDKGGLDAIWVDYIQLLRPDRPTGSREQDVAGLGWALRTAARDLGIPIIALSQLNDTWKKTDKDGAQVGTPTHNNLRESRGLAHTAGYVTLLHRTEQMREGTTHLIQSKTRGGKTGLWRVGWEAKCARYFDLEDDAWSR